MSMSGVQQGPATVDLEPEWGTATAIDTNTPIRVTGEVVSSTAAL